MSARKTFLVIEPVPSEGISLRKLLLETAYYNVLTGYSGKEGIQLLEDFPNVDAAVVHGEIVDPAAKTVIKRLKEIKPGLTVVMITPNGAQPTKPADHAVSSHDPAALLEKLKEIVGAAKEPPTRMVAIERQQKKD